ncbi:MAG: ThuA domain-containing protein [Candidatus Hydrogenedentes bacterium]|nr:ThuA domain-containing protein [Candidatus Hydrogenedentota bacterium]
MRNSLQALFVFTCLCFVACYCDADLAEDVPRMEAALPAQARVMPTAPRKLLVFTLCKGFVHSSIPLGAKMLESMGTKTSAYTTTVSDDPNVFAADSIKQFDAVCMLNTTGELFDDAKFKKSFVEFVKSGKGLIGIHAATDCFYKWSDYGDMMGGYFDGHPWGAGDTVTCKLDDPAHPLNAAFKGRGFDIKDEIYQFQPKPYSREKLRVLVSLDITKTNMDKGGLKREDNDYAISWAHAFGNGRVFYCSLGHNESTYWNAAVLQHYLDGIQFALGDLQAEVAPSATLTPEQGEQSKTAGEQVMLDEGFKDIAKLKLGDPSLPNFLSELIVASHGDETKRADLEKRLIGIYQSSPTPEARQFAAKQLRLIGTDASVPVLATLLADPVTADDGRYALERIATPAAATTLREALAAPVEGTEIGIINSLGEMHDAAALPLIAGYIKSSTPSLRAATATALGKIGGDDAEKSLMTALTTAAPGEEAPYLDALLTAAETRVASGNAARAIEIYEILAAPVNSARAQVCGLQGLARAGSPKGISAILRALTATNIELQCGAAVAARLTTAPDATREFAAQLDKLPTIAQTLLIDALAERGDAAALAAVTSAVSSTDPSVSLAAVRALGAIGNATSVPQLAELAAKGDANVQPIARESLAAMRGEDVDSAIAGSISKGDPSVRRELARALGARRTKSAIPALLLAAADADPTVRAEGFASLAVVAPADQLKPIVELLAVEQDDAARAEGEKAALAVLARNNDPAFAAATVMSALPDVKQGIPAYCSILRVVGKINDPTAYDVLASAAELKNTDVRTTAVRALSEWPNNAPIEKLIEIAQTVEDASIRDIALRGYLRMVEFPDNLAERTPQYDLALKAARSAEDRKLILASIGKQHDPKLIDLITPLAEDPEVKQEATLALEQIKKSSFALTASHGADALANAIDANPATRWTTGEPQKPGQWIQIDLGYVANIAKVALDTTGSAGDFPREYAVFTSNDAKDWGEPALKGKGDGPVTTLEFKDERARFVKIEQTGKVEGLFWSIHELKVETK